MEDLLYCARYPFTSAAKEYLKRDRSAGFASTGPLAAKQQVGGTELDEELIEKGEARLAAALLKGEIPRLATDWEAVLRQEIASYALARMIVSQLNNRYFINRYAVAEAKRAFAYLGNETPGRANALAEELGMHFSESPEGITLPVLEYLAYAPGSTEYKLSTKELGAGKVRLNRHEKYRLMEEAIRKKISASLPLRGKFPDVIAQAATRIREKLPKQELEELKLDVADYPPCIKKLLEDLKASENLPHTSRWALATYLLKAGMPEEKVVSLFSTAPDFEERITRYQVNYLKQRGYSVPSCASLDSYGICVANCRCGSPINFGKPRNFGQKQSSNLKREIKK